MHGIDRQVMADALMQGYSQVADMYIAPADPAFPGADRAVKKYPYDPARAQQLLRAAGWEPGADGILRNAAGAKLDFEMRLRKRGESLGLRLVATPRSATPGSPGSPP